MSAAILQRLSANRKYESLLLHPGVESSFLMADQLYLSLWFPTFSEEDAAARLLSVLKQFPFSDSRPGIGYLAVHAVSFSEPQIFAESFDFRATPEHATQVLSEFRQPDYAYEVEVAWDLFHPVQEADLDETWQKQPGSVTLTAFGEDFGDRVFQQCGHIQIDFGLDTPFLQEEISYTPEIERLIKANIQKLVAFTQAVEKNCGITGRVLWSESEEAENLAQKLIAKLQRVH